MVGTQLGGNANAHCTHQTAPRKTDEGDTRGSFHHDCNHKQEHSHSVAPTTAERPPASPHTPQMNRWANPPKSLDPTMAKKAASESMPPQKCALPARLKQVLHRARPSATQDWKAQNQGPTAYAKAGHDSTLTGRNATCKNACGFKVSIPQGRPWAN